MQLDGRHSALVYKFLSQDPQRIQAISSRDHHLRDRDGIAIACLSNGEIEQLVLSSVVDDRLPCSAGQGRYLMVTKSFYGRFGDHTLDIFDQLCAICSSRTPEIVDHKFLLTDQIRADFHAAFIRCRLHAFTVESSESTSGSLHTLTIRIRYPQP